MLPDFCVIGAPRAGTTTLYEVLIQHTAVYLRGDVKEINFFSSPWLSDPELLRQGIPALLEKYHLLLGAPARRPGILIGDISPWYSILPHCPPLLAQFNPSCKILLLLRDPVERFYSNFYYIKSRYVPDLDFSQQLAEIETYLATGKLNHSPLAASASLYESMYISIYDSFAKFFPAEQIGLFFFDDMIGDFNSYINNICAFLNITPMQNSTPIKANSCKYSAQSKTDYHPRIQAILKPHTDWYHAQQARLGLVTTD